MKALNILIILSIISILVFNSCKDEDNTKPIVTNLEVGHDDTIYVGGEVHLEFEVEDNDRLDYYTVKIHPAGEDHKSTIEHEEWEFDSTFTEIAGLKNFTVHHHAIVVDTSAETGEYHFDLLVVDEAGNSTSEEKDLIMAEGDKYHNEHDHE